MVRADEGGLTNELYHAILGRLGYPGGLSVLWEVFGMKRDMDLVRKILLNIESQESQRYQGDVEIEGYSKEVVNYHLLLLVEAGLITAVDASSQAGFYFIPDRLTWEGHEFIEAARNDTVWNQAKEQMAIVGGFVYELAKPLLIEILKQQLGL